MAKDKNKKGKQKQVEEEEDEDDFGLGGYLSAPEVTPSSYMHLLGMFVIKR